MRPPQTNFLPEHSTLGQSPIFSTFSLPSGQLLLSLLPRQVLFHQPVLHSPEMETERHRDRGREREGEGGKGGREGEDRWWERRGQRGRDSSSHSRHHHQEVSTLLLGDHTQVLASVTQAPVTLRHLPEAQPLPLIGGCCNPLTHPLKRRPGSPQEVPSPLKPLTHYVGRQTILSGPETLRDCWSP